MKKLGKLIPVELIICYYKTMAKNELRKNTQDQKTYKHTHIHLFQTFTAQFLTLSDYQWNKNVEKIKEEMTTQKQQQQQLTKQNLTTSTKNEQLFSAQLLQCDIS